MRVLIVDDHPVFRDGLTRVVRQAPGLTVCGEAADAEEGLAQILHLKPDLVLLDIGLPGRSGLALLKDMCQQCPALPVLVISMHDENQYAERVLQAGGRGYVMKQAQPEKMVDAMLKVLAGQLYVSDGVACSLLGSLAHPRSRHRQSALPALTHREMEVLRLIGEGKDKHHIAQDLGISLKTVDTHRAHLRDKLNLANPTELVRFAVRWVDGEMQGSL